LCSVQMMSSHQQLRMLRGELGASATWRLLDKSSLCSPHQKVAACSLSQAPQSLGGEAVAVSWGNVSRTSSRAKFLGKPFSTVISQQTVQLRESILLLQQSWFSQKKMTSTFASAGRWRLTATRTFMAIMPSPQIGSTARPAFAPSPLKQGIL